MTLRSMARRAAIGLGGCKEDATTSDFRRGGCHSAASRMAVEKLCAGRRECEVPVGLYPIVTLETQLLNMIGNLV